MSARKESLAATLLLAALLLQLLGAALPQLVLICVIGFYVLNAVAAALVKTPLALVAAVGGAAFTAVQGSVQAGAWWSTILVNLIYLAMYLPLQAAFGRALFESGASKQTLALGRRWSVALLLARGFSMMGAMPYFAGQEALSHAQDAPTMLFQLQMGLEVIALIAIVVSYYFMVRYLWRARSLLNTGRKL